MQSSRVRGRAADLHALLPAVHEEATSPVVASDFAGPLPAMSLADSSYSNFLELRIYPVHEDKRDRFLEFFEEHFLESQGVLGMRIWGQFRDLETPGNFVWLRGYRKMEERAAGLIENRAPDEIFGPVFVVTEGTALRRCDLKAHAA